MIKKSAPRVTMVDPQTKEDLSFLQDLAEQAGIVLTAPLGNEETELIEHLANADAVVVQRRPFNRDLMEAAPGLKLVQKMGGRRDGIDLAAAREHGVAVALMTLPGSAAVSEQVFTLLLVLAKKTLIGHQWTVEGAYRRIGAEPKVTSERSHGFQWMKMNDMLVELRQTTLGIVGFGDIGNEVAKRGRAFEMQVLYTDIHPLEPDLEIELGVQYKPLDDLLQSSDFVSLNLPLTPKTEKLIGARELALMKPEAFLINTSRGGIIDEQALVEALRSKQISGAGLDVFVQEPIPFDHPLLTLDNVVLSPHIGGGKGGARLRQPQAVFSNIQYFFSGQAVDYRIL
jgi:phosphoglycerate dehydrogenase-like enzyme